MVEQKESPLMGSLRISSYIIQYGGAIAMGIGANFVPDSSTFFPKCVVAAGCIGVGYGPIRYRKSKKRKENVFEHSVF